MIRVKLFLSSWKMKFILFSVTLQAGCNEIKSNIANCKMSRGEKNKKRNVKIRTQNEKMVETDMDVYY